MLRQARACLAASQGGQFGRGLLGMGRICPVPTQHDHILCRSKPHTKRPELGRCPPSPVAAARLTPLSSGARRPELGGKPSPVPGVDKQRDKPLYGTANLLGPCFCLGCCNALSIVLSYLMSTNT